MVWHVLKLLVTYSITVLLCRLSLPSLTPLWPNNGAVTTSYSLNAMPVKGINGHSNVVCRSRVMEPPSETARQMMSSVSYHTRGSFTTLLPLQWMASGQMANESMCVVVVVVVPAGGARIQQLCILHYSDCRCCCCKWTIYLCVI